MKYMKQIDAMRAIGVSFVLYQHYIGCSLNSLSFFGVPILCVGTSVDSFFVLSGFLITGILLKSKDKIDCGNESVLSCMKLFYTRRTLRIFPIFYLTLLVTFALDIEPVRETIWWHVSYCSNIYSLVVNNVNNGPISHLWSLAVEEQFYLMWPLIILLVPRKHIVKVLLSVIFIAPVFRLYCYYMHANMASANQIVLANIDLLALGGLLVYIKNYQCEQLQPFIRFCLVVGGPIFILSVLSTSLDFEKAFGVFATRTSEGLLICWFVNKISDGFDGFLGYLFELKPLLYLGKISYGLYLYHNFMPDITRKILLHMHIPAPSSLFVASFINTILTVITASISWYLIEKPILNIKVGSRHVANAMRPSNSASCAESE